MKVIGMKTGYDGKYDQDSYYWGKGPSSLAIDLLRVIPPRSPLRLLDIGCGEGRDAVFFARHGYQVTAFDTSAVGVQKTKRLAQQASVFLTAFQADINEYRLDATFDVIFSTGVLHYITPEKKAEILGNYKTHTEPNGINAFMVFVAKPFVPKAPDSESPAHHWRSGELLGLYHDWRIEHSSEEIIDCMSSGVPHQHPVNRVIARKPD